MLRAIQELILLLVGLSLCLEHLGITLGVATITPSKAVNALLLVVVALEWAARRSATPHDHKAIWMAFFGLAVGVGTLQSALGASPRSAIGVGLQYASLLLFYFMLTFVLSDQRRLKLLLGAVVASACIVTVTAALGIGFQTGDRQGGWGGNVNHLAQNLTVAICVAYAFFATSRSLLWRSLLVGAIVLATLGVINTFSRAAYIAVPFMLAMWMLRFGRLDLLRYAIPGVAVLVVGFFFLPESVLERLATLDPNEIEDDESAMSRPAQAYWAFRAILSNPISGIGLANFHFWTAERGVFVGGVHNMYLRIFSDLGLLGFVPMMTILVLTWRDLSRSFLVARRLRRRADPELRWIEPHAIMLQVALLGHLVMSMFHPTGTNKIAWMVFAVSTSIWRLARARYLELADQVEPPTPRWEPFQPTAASAFRTSSR